MKTFVLKFHSSDGFASQSGNVWRTGVIDLYDNDQYRNYSLRRANRGSNLLDNGIYTGLDKISATESEIGFVDNGRFVDLSGRIDIVSWHLDVVSNSGATGQPQFKLSVYHAPDNIDPDYLHATPGTIGDWAVMDGVKETSDIYIIGANRYAYFEVDFDVEAELSNFDITLYVSIDINPPVLDGFFGQTGALLNKFPQWMSINEYNPRDPEYLEIATPSSLGGSLLNAVAGEWLTELSSKMQSQQTQYFIETVDISQKDWIYKTSGAEPTLMLVEGDGVDLVRTANINEFYDTEPEDNAFFWNRNSQEIYCNVLYNELRINGQVVEQDPYQIWNAVDDIGSAVDLFRNHLEPNERFQKRIIDVYKNRPGTSLESFKKTIRRELDLWQYEGATPDSDYVGATPDVFDLEAMRSMPKYFDERGFPTEEFERLIDELAHKYPLTWGFFRFGKAFWDVDGVKREGFSYLPRLADATPVSEEHIESGVGDGNDLYVFRPEEITGEVQFSTKLKVRGRERSIREEYLPLSFEVAVYGTADMQTYSNPALDIPLSIRVVLAGGGDYYANINVEAQSDIDHDQATPSDSNVSLVEWVTVDGFTDATIEFYDRITGQPYVSDASATPSYQIDIDEVSSIVVSQGHWDPDAATITDTIPLADWYGWLVESLGTNFGKDTATSEMDISTTFLATGATAFNMVSYKVNNLGSVADGYSTDVATYPIKINTNHPAITPSSFQLDIPNFLFPTNTSNPKIVVELLTNDEGAFGAFTSPESTLQTFVPSQFLLANGTAFIAEKLEFAIATTSIVFSTDNTGVDYPVNAPFWDSFEAEILVPITGTIDQNGPWRDGVKLPSKNTNYLFKNFINLPRADFGIPDTQDYIITWMGVGVTSPDNAVAWVDSNSVQPAVQQDGELEIEYPDHSIVEYYDTNDSSYKFDSVPVYIKLKPLPDKKWNPKVHSGWFFDGDQEYYLYANPKTVTSTSREFVISDVNRQGAPLTIYGIDGSEKDYNFRQTSSFTLVDSATPVIPEQTLIHVETMKGTGTNELYVAYYNIHDVEVYNSTLGAAVPVVSASSTTNKIELVEPSKAKYDYQITYFVRRSFYVDNNYLDEDNPSIRVVFNDSPSSLGLDGYSVTYESAMYNPATPIDMTLNPMHTVFSEGFIYIDHDEYDLASIEVEFSPSTIMADGEDYGIVTIFTYDSNGNPKPGQLVNLHTSFGILSSASVTTNDEGFAYLSLTAEEWSNTLNPDPATPALSEPSTSNGYQAEILATSGSLNSVAVFNVDIPPTKTGKIVAVMDSDSILAGGNSATSILGKYENASGVGVYPADVFWSRGRTIYEAFTDPYDSGSVETSPDGRFSTGDFLSHTTSGYWFVALQNDPNTGNIGDIVYWFEYPNVNDAVDPITNLPIGTDQDATPYWEYPNYTFGSVFPVSYDEATPQNPAESATPQWEPPKWYPINRYRQYQMGVYGVEYYEPSATPDHPDYTEF